MIARILEVFHGRLEQVPWMSNATREKALQKFSAIRVKIGYPDKWIDYSKLQIDRGAYVTNVLRANAFDFHRRLDKLPLPVDKSEWHMTPPTVNAYNNPTGNEVVFPAGILQPPFFDPQADDAVNYGGIGAVIAHEITHGYDDQGRKYDALGNLQEWWTLKDEAQFKERSQKLVTQFSQYEPLPGLKINGELCLGENIADLGGVSIAFEALQRALTEKPRGALIEGFTPEQRFFLAWAKVWRSQYREEALRKQITLDVHAPGQFRAIGAPSNVDAFFKAFGIKPGDPMWYPVEARATIW
jgi:putative endopeptidase